MRVRVVNMFPKRGEINRAKIYIVSAGQWSLLDLPCHAILLKGNLVYVDL